MDSAIKKKTFERSRMMNEFTELFAKSKALIDNARNSMGVVVNAVTVYTSYLLGKYIIEEEQQGSERARYGIRVLDSLSAYLTKEYGHGFSRSNLAGMRKFYLTYKDREPQIVQSGIGQLGMMQKNVAETRIPDIGNHCSGRLGTILL